MRAQCHQMRCLFPALCLHQFSAARASSARCRIVHSGGIVSRGGVRREQGCMPRVLIALALPPLPSGRARGRPRAEAVALAAGMAGGAAAGGGLVGMAGGAATGGGLAGVVDGGLAVGFAGRAARGVVFTGLAAGTPLGRGGGRVAVGVPLATGVSGPAGIALSKTFLPQSGQIADIWTKGDVPEHLAQDPNHVRDGVLPVVLTPGPSPACRATI